MVNNLYFPEGTLTSVVDVNNRNLLISVDDAIHISEAEQRQINTLISVPIISINQEKGFKYVSFEHGIQFIKKISYVEKKEIPKLKMFNVKL